MDHLVKKLSFRDRYLTLRIFIAMTVGIGIGYFSPAVPLMIIGLSVGTTHSFCDRAGPRDVPPLTKVK